MAELGKIVQMVKTSYEMNVKMEKAVRITTDTMKAGQNFAIKQGKCLADALKTVFLNTGFGSEAGKEDYETVVRQVLGDSYAIISPKISKTYSDVQTAINKKAKINLKPKTAKEDGSKLDKIARKIASYETKEEAAYMFGDPVVDVAQKQFVDSIKANAEFQKKAGLYVMVKRTYEGAHYDEYHKQMRDCEWCMSKEYDGPLENAPDDFFAVHGGCRCQFEYTSRKGITDRWTGSR